MEYAPSLFVLACYKDNLHRKMIAQSENTQHRGKDHYTAGLQFNKVGFDRKGKYVVIIM